ncbi:MAG: hypothetical protein ACQKBW_06620, partial [Puniceicoccales bacterium]
AQTLTPGEPLPDDVLLQIMRLYVGSWHGSIDLTDKYGTVIQTLPVESEYRLEKKDGKTMLLGRFQFGRSSEAKYSSSEAEISKGYLLNRINQQGKNTVYRGEIEGGRIAWREYGVPRSEYNVFYESFGERNDRRVCTTQSRNLMRDADGVEKTYFTAGRYLYAGAVNEWTLPEPSFKAAVVPSVETPDATAKSGMATLGDLTRKRSASTTPVETELAPDLKTARAEIASLQEQLEAEQAASAKLRARIEQLEARIAELTGQSVPAVEGASTEATASAPESASTDDTGAATGSQDSDDDSDSGRSSFRSRVR